MRRANREVSPLPTRNEKIAGMAARGERRPAPGRPHGGTARTLRIAAACVPGTPHARYRVLLPLRELERRGHRVLWSMRDPDAEAANLDVLLIHHFFDEQTLELVERLGERGVAVVWDKDDDLSQTPRRAPAYKTYGGRRGIKRSFARSVAIASTASLMTTPSAHLARRFGDLGVPNVEVLDNYVAREDVGGDRPRHRGIVIGVTAAWEHAEDFEQLGIDRALQRLLRAHEGVRVVAIGYRHDLPADRYMQRAPVPAEQLIATEREFDIGLAPLADTAFNRARSAIKLKEYAAAGAMWLASPVGPYLGLGEQQGGMLVGDDEWYAALERVVVDYKRRAALMECARAWARTQTIDRAAEQWESAFVRAVERVRARAA